MVISGARLQLFMVLTVILPLNLRSQSVLPPTDVSNSAPTHKYNVTVAEESLNDSVDLNGTDLEDLSTRGIRSNTSTEAPAPLITALPTVYSRVQTTEDCQCDITSDFCDIGCCCDFVDCGTADLSSVFNGCKQETQDGVCIENWLMFRANVDPELVTVTDSLFCVRKGNGSDITAQTPFVAPEGPTSISSPHFSLQEPSSSLAQNSDFYKVDDVILTYYTNTSVVSALRQPSAGSASSSCLDRNPAKFLRSGSFWCSRVVSAQSCRAEGDGGLSVFSYFTGFSLLKVPRLSEVNSPNLMIPVVPVVILPGPGEHNGSCLNVVSKVEYVITYTSAGEITEAAIRAELTNARFGTQLLQQHAIQFQLAAPSPSLPKSPSGGLLFGTPLIGWFGGESGPLTIQGLSSGGECAAELPRTPILFNHNTMTGCTFRSTIQDCASLRDQIYRVLRGATSPATVAMTAGSEPPRSRVVVQGCPEPSPDEGCETRCLLPVSLSVRILWAQRGTLALPQNHVLGVKYIFTCQILKCPIISALPLTTEVIFSDTSIYPEPPRAEPRPEWKFPFGFFSGGADELDVE
ncbi:tectonic-3-like [Trichomycterus rosablanca]|uniref:tectonic-3-like n=1 Tax=Trichomycterus rosablanca TaxID=2290929 RepID=UPI002F351B58